MGWTRGLGCRISRPNRPPSNDPDTRSNSLPVCPAKIETLPVGHFNRFPAVTLASFVGVRLPSRFTIQVCPDTCWEALDACASCRWQCSTRRFLACFDVPESASVGTLDTADEAHVARRTDGVMRHDNRDTRVTVSWHVTKLR